PGHRQAQLRRRGAPAETAFSDRKASFAVRRAPAEPRMADESAGALSSLSLFISRYEACAHGREKRLLQRKNALLLVLREESARGQEADCRPFGLHLRRVHRSLQ